MRLREHPRTAPVRSRTAEARSLADRLHEWLLLAESSRAGDRAAPLVLERPDGSAIAVHLLRAPEDGAEESIDESVGEMLSLATLRAL